MSELYDRIMSERGSLQKLATRIPGYEGYQDKKARRTADRMLRDYITAELSKRINRLVQIEKTLLDDGGMSYMSKTSSAKSKLQLFHDKVKTAAPGYSGPFEAVRIESEQLESLYSFDEAQMRYVDQIDTALTTLKDAVSSKSGIDEAIAALDAVATEAIEAFSLRDDAITNLSNSV